MKVEVSGISLSMEGKDGALAQQTGSSSALELPDGATVADLLRRVGGDRDQVQKILVNGDDAEETRRLQDGDAVAFVGQVSGL